MTRGLARGPQVQSPVPFSTDDAGRTRWSIHEDPIGDRYLNKELAFDLRNVDVATDKSVLDNFYLNKQTDEQKSI